MPATVKVKILSVRLPEPEIKLLKVTAASKGMSVQEAVQTAVQSWVLNAQSPKDVGPFLALRGSMADSPDVDTMRRREREAELAKDNRWF